jgi:hypothetical protein
MLLDAHAGCPSAPATARASGQPARSPIPAEPGRVELLALAQVARERAGRAYAGDERLETSLYALKRYLWRLGHSSRNRAGTYATSLPQLVTGLAPIMGWRRTTLRDGRQIPLSRAALVRAHRRTVQRWLDWLAAAGIADHIPERDQDGNWWRTRIVLHVTPAIDPGRLAAARTRLRNRGRRERRAAARAHRRRRSGQLQRRRDLRAITSASATPTGATRARLGRARSCAIAAARRAQAVDAIRAPRPDSGDNLTHPFGAPSTSENPTRSPEVVPSHLHGADTSAHASNGPSLSTFGAQLRAGRAAGPSATASTPVNRCQEEGGPGLDADDENEWLEAMQARCRAGVPAMTILVEVWKYYRPDQPWRCNRRRWDQGHQLATAYDRITRTPGGGALHLFWEAVDHLAPDGARSNRIGRRTTGSTVDPGGDAASLGYFVVLLKRAVHNAKGRRAKPGAWA